MTIPNGKHRMTCQRVAHWAPRNEEASQLSRLNSEIEELKKKLAAAESGAGGGFGGDIGVASAERKAMQEKLQGQLADMQQMVSSTWEDKAQLSADYESQISKALDDQKKQTKAMQEECRKRLRVLEDQNDLELSIRGLMDTLQSLPAEVSGGATPLPPLCEKLCSCELPQQWLKLVADIAETLGPKLGLIFWFPLAPLEMEESTESIGDMFHFDRFL